MEVRRAAVFVDGENLVVRYQEMLKQGLRPHPDVTHFQDQFVWSKRLLLYGMFHISRVAYYVSAVGDDQHINAVTDRIRAARFYAVDTQDGIAEPFVARVFKKAARSQKSRLVDIHITLDAMIAAGTGKVDTIILITGDGDFIPLVQELMRRGIRVHCLGLSSGLSPDLARTPDYHQVIDGLFFADNKAVEAAAQ